MQTRIGSLCEAITNIVIGFSVGFLANITVLPAFGYDVTYSDGALISVAFTVISLIRSYIIRRLYNKYNWFGRG